MPKLLGYYGVLCGISSAYLFSVCLVKLVSPLEGGGGKSQEGDKWQHVKNQGRVPMHAPDKEKARKGLVSKGKHDQVQIHLEKASN